MVAFISLSTHNCWQQTHKNRGKKIIKPLKFHKQLQSPTGFSSLLKRIRSSLCSWNSSWAAGKASCFSLLEVPPSPSNGTEGMSGRDAQNTPIKPLELHTSSFHTPAWDQDGIFGERMQQKRLFEGCVKHRYQQRAEWEECSSPGQVLLEKEDSPCPPRIHQEHRVPTDPGSRVPFPSLQTNSNLKEFFTLK